MQRAVNCKLLLYADDSALIVSSKDIREIESSLTTNLFNLSEWLVDNKLSLHLGKTESILFGTRHQLKKCNSLKISCNNVEISSTSNVVYLGATIDQTLSGEPMAKLLIKNVTPG